METLSGNFRQDCAALDKLLGAGKNYDVIARDLTLGMHQGRIWCIDGYADDQTVERILAFWLSIPPKTGFQDAEDFIALGADRLGTSRIVKLAMQQPGEGY